MKQLRFFFLSFFISSASFAGSPADSLRALLQKAQEDTSKVNVLLALGKIYSGTSPGFSLSFSEQAISLSEELKYKKGIAYGLKNKGIAYYNQSKYPEAIDYWQQSLAVFDSMGDLVGVANMESNLGVIYSNNGDNTKALEYHLKTLKTAEQIHDTLRIATALQNIGNVYIDKKATYDQALEYFMRAAPISEKLGDRDLIGAIYVNIGETYLKKGNEIKSPDKIQTSLYDSALFYFQKSLKAYDENSENVPYPLNDIGKLYAKEKKYEEAIKYHERAYEKAKHLDAKLDMAQSLTGLAQAYEQQNNMHQALTAYREAEQLANAVGDNKELEDIYKGLGVVYSNLKDFKNAFRYQYLLINVKDILYNTETDKKLGSLQSDFDLYKKQQKVDLLTKDQQIKSQEIRRQKIVRNSFVGGFAIVLLFAGVFFTQRNRISKEKKRSDELLLNILPAETAEELKATGTAKAKSFDSVSVLFTDFKNFTQASEKLSPEELVAEINHCYSEFDKIITNHGLEKIKTIGDAYMCAGGLPVTNTTHPVDIVAAGLEMVKFIEKNKQERLAKDQPFFELRCGIHTGPVVAGIVGIKKFAYDIWGDTVNTASRMESSGEIGKVNISGETYELVKDKFKCIHRGKVKAKNKGEIDMYFVDA
jgi:adenylate cyclase